MRWLPFVAILVLVQFLVAPIPSSANGSIYVAPSGAGGGSCLNPNYNTIQAAVTAASNDPTIFICEGTYTEQVSVSGKTLTLKGAAAANTVIVAPTTASVNTTSLATGSSIAAIILVMNSDVTIEGITIDGSAAAPTLGGGGYVGIFFRNANGAVVGSTIKHIADAPPSGNQRGIGILVQSGAQSSSAGTSDVSIVNNDIFGYQKGGVVANEVGTNVSISGNTTTGFGPVNFIAQNGIQLGWGATGTVTRNTITRHYYTGPGWVSTGLLFFNVDASQVKHSRNMFRENQTNFNLLTQQACPHIYGGFYDTYNLCN